MTPGLLVAVHDAPARDGQRNRGIADLAGRDAEDVLVKYDEIGAPTRLDRPEDRLVAVDVCDPAGEGIDGVGHP